MPLLQIFDKPLCCSTGVCGPAVDSTLVKFAADLQWLEKQDVRVQRINPAHQPDLFAGSELVRNELKTHGSDCLPVVVVDDLVVSRGSYPGRTQLAAWVGVSVSPFPELSVVNTSSCPGTDESSGSSSCCT
jgi:hypothetical protein